MSLSARNGSMTVKAFKNGIPTDFDKPSVLPNSDPQRELWQNLNRNWWESNPMRYDFTEKIQYREHSAEFYKEIDQRFFASVIQFMPWTKKPFDNLVDFENLRNKHVLEIGVGNGSHAQLLSSSTDFYTGIDLTQYAVDSSRKRFEINGLKGKIMRMDAEKLAFEDNSFDLVWSWGVIHHSSDTLKILREIHRVLKPGGKVMTMVYHRSAWNSYIRGGVYYGIIKRGFAAGKTINTLIQETTDGAIARYYTVEEWDQTLAPFFVNRRHHVYGSKSQLIPLPYTPLKERLMKIIPNALGRWITNRAFFGFLLVSQFQKGR